MLCWLTLLGSSKLGSCCRFFGHAIPVDVFIVASQGKSWCDMSWKVPASVTADGG